MKIEHYNREWREIKSNAAMKIIRYNDMIISSM